ncbi:hypothetical protein H4N58_09980 [Mumia sp. ZJ1417]|uniref:hypothetical protein n=1 Tax=unclassified Mumia TaxID=2621872 RepID=UPI0014241984|nr:MULTISPECIES: hypothetical protein [unclassified Mumia]QMW68134.1 hypothetical protein H4N58_09980 [Mumia sp. ZJ1417]
MRADDLEQRLVRDVVRRDEEAPPGVEGIPGEIADDAASCLADRDARGDVEVVPELPVRDVRRASATSFPPTNGRSRGPSQFTSTSIESAVG